MAASRFLAIQVKRVTVAFTLSQYLQSKIGSEMDRQKAFRAARIAGLGLVGLCVAACASTPLPHSRSAGPSADATPFSRDAPPRVLDSNVRLQCVPFARNASGIQIFGDANTWWSQAAGRYVRSQTPAPGAVMVTRGYRDPGRGHVAVVTEIVSDRVIRVDHANWLNGGEISVGVPVMDVSPGNDWSQVRVWNIPGGHWGGRVYDAEGFIHPFNLVFAAAG